MTRKAKVTENKQQEQGRSMVEMLGTLAIVGVLSVGGIVGYTYLMNKHHANTLLTETSKRAIVLLSQRSSGHELSMREFKNTTEYGTFDPNILKVKNGVGITVSGIKSAVCEELIRKTEGAEVTIAINTGKTLADVEIDDCKNTNEMVFIYGIGIDNKSESITDPECEGVVCMSNLTCYHGECKCNDGTFMCGEQCCEEGTYCTQGADSSIYTCSVPKGNCTKNSDCNEETEYCKFSKGTCSDPGTGACTDKGVLMPYTLELPSGTLTVYKSSTAMNWWGAANLCQSHGKQLLTISDLGISDESGEIVCYYEHSKTTDPSYYCICEGEEKCSETAKTLSLLGSTGSIWLADNPPSGSCLSHRIILNLSAIGYDSRNRDTYYALCR